VRLLRARRERPRGRRAAEKRDELASSYVEHGLPPKPAVPAYRRLRMARKRSQVLGVDLNRSESSQAGVSRLYGHEDPASASPSLILGTGRTAKCAFVVHRLPGTLVGDKLISIPVVLTALNNAVEILCNKIGVTCFKG